MEYVEPITTPARYAEEKDIPRIVQDAEMMRKLCWKPHGRHRQAHAIAHPQVHKNPLRFFVLRMGETLINPMILARLGDINACSEGCMSFPHDQNAEVPRHETVQVRYFTPVRTPNGGWALQRQEKTLSGMPAQIFQHEMDHLEGVSVYDYDAEKVEQYLKDYAND